MRVAASVVARRLRALGFRAVAVSVDGTHLRLRFRHRVAGSRVVAAMRPGLLAIYDFEPAVNGPFRSRPTAAHVLTCSSHEVVCPGKGLGGSIEPPKPGTTYYYVATSAPRLTNRDLKAKLTRSDFDPATGEPVVLFEFNAQGSIKFRRLTAAEFRRGRLRREPQHFAIALDGEIRAFPQIDYTKSDLSGGISANAELSGLGSRRDAELLAVTLSEPLPVGFVRVR